MKILITGGAGFIGSHLADKLIQKGHIVLIVDNLSTGFKQNLNPRARFIKTDILDIKKIEKIFKKESPEIVYHLAAQIDVRKSVEDPIYDFKTNILGSSNLIQASLKHKVKKFIFSSSGGAVYGDANFFPTPESHKEWPTSPYGISKLSVDKILNYYNKTINFNYTSLRYGNVYGPRQNPHSEAGVVSTFLSKMFRGEQPMINGNGKQTRDYVYVEDVVNANILALKNFKKTGIYNVGTSQETNVNEIFSKINKNFGNKFKKVHGPVKLGEQKRSCLDYSRIEKDFGWKPKYDLESGIKQACKWFKSRCTE